MKTVKQGPVGVSEVYVPLAALQSAGPGAVSRHHL